MTHTEAVPARIRPAAPADAPFAAPLIQETIGPIGHALTGDSGDEGAARVIAGFFGQPGNRLSHANTLIVEEGVPLGLAVLYPGDEAEVLDRPFRERLRMIGLPDHIDTEAAPGELYLDTLAVTAHARGRGLGGQLLDDCAGRAAALGLPRVGLLVAGDNPAARLYLRHGFAPAGMRRVAGHLYTHLTRAVG